jgi:hypothetical protein
MPCSIVPKSRGERWGTDAVVMRGACKRTPQWDANELTQTEHAELRRILETCEVSAVSESIREYVEREMPDLIEKLPPRLLH